MAKSIDEKQKKNNKKNTNVKNNKRNNNTKVNNKNKKISSSTKNKKVNEKKKEVKKVVTEKKETKKEIINKFEDNSDELLFDFVNKKKTKEEAKERRPITFGILDVLIMMVITAILSCVLVGSVLNYRYKKMGCYNQTYSSDQNLNEFIKVYAEVVDNYYEDVDKNAMIDAAIEGMLEFLQDKYSIYLDADGSGNLSDTLSGTYDGIGIGIYGASITEVYKGSPAYEAGIKSGDIISSINGISINNENAGEISKIIGDNEQIALVVKRGDEEINYELKVSKITLQVVSSNYFQYNKKNIGYIKISSFTSTATEQFAEAFIELENKGIDSIIIDLRGNGGGYINAVIGVSSVFLDKDDIIYIVEKKGQREEIKDKSEDNRDYKMIILIDGNTASASEIFTLAMKDNYGAIVVGTKSYGKGSVQTTKTLSDGTMMKYTSAMWYGPNGESIDGKGIEPDYTVKYQANKDAYLEKALDLLK